jgi:hypothetical protein
MWINSSKSYRKDKSSTRKLLTVWGGGDEKMTIYEIFEIFMAVKIRGFLGSDPI